MADVTRSVTAASGALCGFISPAPGTPTPHSELESGGTKTSATWHQMGTFQVSTDNQPSLFFTNINVDC